MPHIVVKCYPGNTPEQKKALADKIAKDVEEVFGSRSAAISVAVVDVAKEDWKNDVYQTEIETAREEGTLVREPGYKM